MLVLAGDTCGIVLDRAALGLLEVLLQREEENLGVVGVDGG